MTRVKTFDPKLAIDQFRRLYEMGENECWLWTGPVDVFGAPLFHIFGESIRARRFSLSINGSVCEPLDPRHVYSRCKNKLCVNPDHLYQPATMYQPGKKPLKLSRSERQQLRRLYLSGELNQKQLRQIYRISGPTIIRYLSMVEDC